MGAGCSERRNADMSKRKAGPGLNRSTAFDWINYAVMLILAFIMI